MLILKKNYKATRAHIMAACDTMKWGEKYALYVPLGTGSMKNCFRQT